MKEYRLSKGIRLWISIVSPIVIVVGIAALTEANSNDLYSSIPAIFFRIINPVLLIITFAGCWINFLRFKYLIGPNGITWIRLFSRRQLLFSEIKGFLEMGPDGRILIVPKEVHRKGIIVSTYTANQPELECWVGTHFEDLETDLPGEENS